MASRKASEQMAHDDLFFSIALIGIGIYASNINWVKSDWWGLFGTALITIFGIFWLYARIYHLTHKDEVFGPQDPTDV